TAYMITDMLKDVVSYYSTELTIPGYVHAAKTGTTNYTEEQIAKANIPSDGVPDSWVVGYSPYYTMSVWVGYDNPFEEGNSLVYSDGSRRLSRLIYQAAMSRLVSDLESRDWERPDSVVEASIENGSNPPLLALSGSSDSVTELFVRGTQPTETAEPEYVLSALIGLIAQYLAEEDKVEVSWDAFELPEDIDKDVEYVVSVNGKETVQSETEFTISDPPREVITISVAVRVDGETGPAAEVQITVQEPEDDEDEEKPEDDNESEETPESEKPEKPEEPEESEDTGSDTPPEEEDNNNNSEENNNE